MKNKKLVFLIKLIFNLFMCLFLLSIIIVYKGRGIVAFFVFILLAGLILSFPISIIRKKYASKYKKKEKLEPKNLELKRAELEIEKQQLLNNCPNCGFEVKKIWNFCPSCHTILKEEQNYTRLLLPNPINDYPYKVRRLNDIIEIPNICPICASNVVQKEYKIKPRFSYKKPYADSRISRAHLKFFFCQKHTHEMKKNNVIYILFLISFFSFYISLPFLIIWVVSSSTFFPVTITILILTGIIWGFVYTVRKILKMYSLIRSHIFHEYYPELGAILAVRNTDWAEEFKRNNKFVYVIGLIEYSLNKSEQLKKRYEIYFWSSLLLMIAIGFLSLFLSISIHERFLILSVLGTICFGSIIVYTRILITNLEKKRLEEYSDFLGKINI